VLRQLWLQAAELTEDALADAIRAQLRSQPGPGLAPRWTTRRASRALSGELGRHDDRVWAVAALADGRVVSGGDDRRVLVWDPASPASGPLELGRHDNWVWAVAALADGRVVSGGRDRRVLVWDPASPASGPLELGCSVTALAMGSLRPGVSFLVVAHAGAGFSLWSLIGCHEE
jgi:WD40 repeat protein